MRTPTISALAAKARVLRALGWRSVWRVARYRLTLRLRLAPVLRLSAAVPPGDVFDARPFTAPPAPVAGAWRSEGRLFGNVAVPAGAAPPLFSAHPLTGAPWPGADRPWWQLSDFGHDDIKLVWELSRFPWLVPMAQQARAGEPGALARLNRWLAAWLRDDPPYLGPNWKCGQEASLRVLTLALAAHVLEQVDRPSPAMVALVRLHLRRIAPTIGYALGQDNNHGTSEAIALFVGGSWLARVGDRDAAGWARTGRRWLDERAGALIASDGSFSQHSVVYHRLVLDSYSLAEWWRRRLDLPSFAGTTIARLRQATGWLRQMTDPESGDAPNLGANDGARLIVLSDAGYRDFRPSVDRASVLFDAARAFPDDARSGDELAWLGLEARATATPLTSTQYDDGGYAVLRAGEARALLRYPRFAFRPSQADALHLDLWLGSRNLSRDAGTLSYHGSAERSAYFVGTRAHSTIEFDGRDQMPRLSRFLFGDWLVTDRLEPLRAEGDGWRFAAGYRDGQGAGHLRRVALAADRLVVEDEIDGFAERAVLRWRLAPGDWHPIDGGVTDGSVTIRVTVHSDTGARPRLASGAESLFYGEEHQIPVLEVETTRPGPITTVMSWTR